MEPQAEPPHRLRTALLANLAAILERCDEQMVPAVYRFLGASFAATPTQLGYITLSRALVQALSSPLGGIAGHCLHRGRVVGAGCLLWAACTAAFATCRSLRAGVAVWGVNGVGLALVLPNTQSLIADLFPAARRGRAFGLLYLTAALGGMLGALYATNLGAHRPLGLDGWRVAFASLAAAAAVAGAANLALAADPLRPAGGAQPPPKLARVEVAALPPVRHGSGSRKHGSAAVAAPAGPDEELELLALLQRQGAGLGGGDSRSTEAPADGHLEGPADGPSSGGVSQLDPPEHRAPPPPAQPRLDLRGLAADVASVLRIPTFLIIVLQGIMGSIPWSALVFLTLYFQLLGMSDAQASGLVALFLAGTAFGGLLGGIVGDAAARLYPHHGRIAVTQFSVAVGIPFACLLFKGMPMSGGAGNVALYAAVLLSFALLKAWPAPACNNPLFAEIVPARQRNLVYAWDRCFEGAIAACAAPLVGLLAERLFGFSGSGTVSHDRVQDLANARALGSALLAFLVVPWSLTLTLYTGLHWTYPADKAAALRRQRLELSGLSSSLEEHHVLIDRLSSDGGSPASPLSPVSEASVELLPRGVVACGGAGHVSSSSPAQQAQQERRAGKEMEPGALRWGDEEAGLGPLGGGEEPGGGQRLIGGGGEPGQKEGRR